VNPRLRRRRGGPVWIVVLDLFRDAWWTRNWFVAVVLVLSVVAALVALFGQTVLPIAIYPAL